MGEENDEKKSVQKEILLQCYGRFQVGTTGSNTIGHSLKLCYKRLMYKQFPPSCQHFRKIFSCKRHHGEAMFFNFGSKNIQKVILSNSSFSKA